MEGNAPAHPAFRGDFPPGAVVGQEDQDVTPGQMIAIGMSQRFHRCIPNGPQALLGGWECSDGISRGTELVCGRSRRFRRPGARMQLAEHAGSPRSGDLHAQTPRSEGSCGRIEPPVRLHGLDAHDHRTVHLPQARHVLTQPREHVTNTVWHVIPDPADHSIDCITIRYGPHLSLVLVVLDTPISAVHKNAAFSHSDVHRGRQADPVRRMFFQPRKRRCVLGFCRTITWSRGSNMGSVHQGRQQPSWRGERLRPAVHCVPAIDTEGKVRGNADRSHQSSCASSVAAARITGFPLTLRTKPSQFRLAV